MNHGSSDCVRAGEAVGRWLGDMHGRGYSVLPVDDEPAVRSMLRRWLAGHDLTVCAEAATGNKPSRRPRRVARPPSSWTTDFQTPQARNSSPGYGSFVRLPASCLFTADEAATRAVQATGAAVAVVKGSRLDDLHKGSPRQRTPGRHHEVRRASRQHVGGGDRRLRHAHRGRLTTAALNSAIAAYAGRVPTSSDPPRAVMSGRRPAPVPRLSAAAAGRT